jgi:hypothetical protein
MLWESVEKAINLGLGEGDVVADFPSGLVKEVVAQILGLWRAEGSLSWSGEALHNSVEFVSGNGGSIGSNGDD